MNGKPSREGARVVDAEVGLRIRARRRELNMSQETLAHALGVSFQQVQKYERGSARVSASRLWEISKVLDVTTSHFFGQIGDEQGVREAGPSESSYAAFVFSEEGSEILHSFSALRKDEQRAVLRLIRGLLATRLD